MEDNPYQSPCSGLCVYPTVEIVLRPRLAGRAYQQIYRFACDLVDERVLRERVIAYFLRQSTHLLSSSSTGLEFERLGTSIYAQLYRSEKSIPQSIAVSFGPTSSGNVVTCHYRLRLLYPDMIVAPHPLEAEVRELAFECLNCS
jgi:hypothetical protein